MEIHDELKFEGCNFFRQRLTYSLLSGRPIVIKEIRPFDDDPGVKEHETKLISMFEKISNGTRFEINRTGTQVKFYPGLIFGGELELDCGLNRCISYFLDPLLLVAPFCKNPLKVVLKGVTNKPTELSVDAIRQTWLPVFNKFVINDEILKIKIINRGFLPDGGGKVSLTTPIVRTLRPVQRKNPGKICKIRGLAYVCKVHTSFANRMIDAAKKTLRGYLSDVYITLDQRKGGLGGLSPGFGIFIYAETTEGVYYHGEAMSNPKGSKDDQLIAEEVGQKAAGGCLDTSAQILAATFMTLGDKDVSNYLFGPLSLYTVYALRHLKIFFEQTFKIDQLWNIKETEENEKKEFRIGSKDKALMTCVGVGFFNINKIQL